MLYDQKHDKRIFPISKSYLHHEMDRGVKATGLKLIRIHDLRHSHVSLLIELGFSAVAIADRAGHESIEITYRYAHLFPSKQAEMANRLGELKKGADIVVTIILTNKLISTLGSLHIILLHFCLITSSSDLPCCQGRSSVHFSLYSMVNQS